MKFMFVFFFRTSGSHKKPKNLPFLFTENKTTFKNFQFFVFEKGVQDKRGSDSSFKIGGAMFLIFLRIHS